MSSWTFLNHLETSWTFLSLLKPFRTFLVPAQTPWNLWKFLEPAWTFLNLLEPSWTCLALLEPSWTFFTLLYPSWPFLTLLDSWLVTLLDPSLLCTFTAPFRHFIAHRSKYDTERTNGIQHSSCQSLQGWIFLIIPRGKVCRFDIFSQQIWKS